MISNHKIHINEEDKRKSLLGNDGPQTSIAGDRVEEVTSDEVCSREFVDKKVERSVQAAGFQEAETPSKNGVGENYEMSSIVNEEVLQHTLINTESHFLYVFKFFCMMVFATTGD
jgi:hypothetical protein